MTVQFCAAAMPSHAQIWTLFPLAPLPLLLSMQAELLTPETIVPVAPPPPLPVL